MDVTTKVLFMIPIAAFILGIIVLIKLIIGVYRTKNEQFADSSQQNAAQKKSKRFDIALIIGLCVALIFVGQLAYVSWLIVFMGQPF